MNFYMFLLSFSKNITGRISIRIIALLHINYCILSLLIGLGSVEHKTKSLDLIIFYILNGIYWFRHQSVNFFYLQELFKHVFARIE
jgi:hypothetical protein